jgi:hypothetical protein
MPSNLNERLVERLEEEAFAKPSSHHRRIWPWIAAACVASVMIVVIIAPKNKNTQELSQHTSSGEFAIRQGGVGDLKSPEAIKNHRIANPNTQDSRITNSTEPKAMAVAESKTVRKSKKKAVSIQTASIEQKDSSLFTLHSSLQKNDSSLFTLHSSLKPAVLTERDIPITRPENYRYTPEEIALLKKQADDAYVKWVQLELEIAKYNLEQMAQQ